MFLELPLEALEKGKRVRGRARKPGQNLVTEQAPRLSRRVFHDVLAHGDLSVSGNHNFVVAAHAQDRGAVYLRRILPQWHPMIIPRAVAPTNAGFRIEWSCTFKIRAGRASRKILD